MPLLVLGMIAGLWARRRAAVRCAAGGQARVTTPSFGSHRAFMPSAYRP
jgi:hypothetical protein